MTDTSPSLNDPMCLGTRDGARCPHLACSCNLRRRAITVPAAAGGDHLGEFPSGSLGWRGSSSRIPRSRRSAIPARLATRAQHYLAPHCGPVWPTRSRDGSQEDVLSHILCAGARSTHARRAPACGKRRPDQVSPGDHGDAAESDTQVDGRRVGPPSQGSCPCPLSSTSGRCAEPLSTCPHPRPLTLV